MGERPEGTHLHLLVLTRHIEANSGTCWLGQAVPTPHTVALPASHKATLEPHRQPHGKLLLLELLPDRIRASLKVQELAKQLQSGGDLA